MKKQPMSKKNFERCSESLKNLFKIILKLKEILISAKKKKRLNK